MLRDNRAARPRPQADFPAVAEGLTSPCAPSPPVAAGGRQERLKAEAALISGCSPISGASSGHKSAWRLPFLLCVLLDRAVLVKNLPRPLPLALCPRAVGGAPASLVGARQTCASLAALAALSLTGDRRIVLRRGRQLGAPAHPLSSSRGGGRLVAGAPGTLKTPARRVSAGGGRQAGCWCGRPRVRGPEGEPQSRPVGPESSRNAGGRQKESAAADKAGGPATTSRGGGLTPSLLPGAERPRRLRRLWKFQVTSFVRLRGNSWPHTRRISRASSRQELFRV